MTVPVEERPLEFDCQGDRLLGILSAPGDPGSASKFGVVIVVGGPQYRAGSHRQFVQLARVLSASGHAVLRFDVRGMGDSSGEQRGFEALSEDIGAAVAALMAARPEIGKVVLWGLCDGASASLMYLDDTRDRRIGGLCLVNPWVRSDASLARTHLQHYYLQRLMQPEFWRKLASGRIALQAARGLIDAVRLALAGRHANPAPAGMPQQMPYQQRMSRACRQFNGPILLLLSEKDHTAQEFAGTVAADRAWRRAMARPNVTRLSIRGADHTLSDHHARRSLESACTTWLQRLAPQH